MDKPYILDQLEVRPIFRDEISRWNLYKFLVPDNIKGNRILAKPGKARIVVMIPFDKDTH